MRKFTFRLQRVLEYREMAEQWAKEAYLEAKTARLEIEIDLEGIEAKRQRYLNGPILTIDDHVATEACLQRLDSQEAEKRTILQVLINEEEQAFEAWKEKRVETQVLAKMREKASTEHELEVNRIEQSELDEWAVTRKKSA